MLTGGPCGGKTTAFPLLTEKLTAYGFAVFRVPEAATLLQLGGLSFAGMDADQVIHLQSSIMRMQFALENEFESIARHSTRHTRQPCVLLSDRGLMDSRAYVDAETWPRVLEVARAASHFPPDADVEVELRDRRYDAVIHLVTAADGAEKFYTTANNATRWESPEQAAAVDMAIRHAWLGSPHLRIIGNEGGITFGEKIQRALAAICQKLGIRQPVGTRKFFLCSTPLDAFVPPNSRDFQVTHIYLDAVTSGHWVSTPTKPGAGLASGSDDEVAPPPAHVRLTHRLEIPQGTRVVPTPFTAGSAAGSAAGGSATVAAPSSTMATAAGGGGAGAVADAAPSSTSEASADASASSAASSSVVSATSTSMDLVLGRDGRPLTATFSGLTKARQYFILRARQLVDGVRQEHFRSLTSREFSSLLPRADPHMVPVIKRRRLFVYASRAFEWDEVVSPAQYAGLTLVSTDVESPDQVVDLPPFLTIVRDVTGDENFLTSAMASGASTATKA